MNTSKQGDTKFNMSTHNNVKCKDITDQGDKGDKGNQGNQEEKEHKEDQEHSELMKLVEEFKHDLKEKDCHEDPVDDALTKFQCDLQKIIKKKRKTKSVKLKIDNN